MIGNQELIYPSQLASEFSYLNHRVTVSAPNQLVG